MKLRFFGDSWAWSWQPVFSKRVSNFLLEDFKKKDIGAIPFIEIYLKHFGIDCEIHNFPGFNFEEVVQSVLNTDNHSTVDYNIILMPSIWRGKENSIPTLSNYEKFIEEWNANIKKNLSALNDWTVEHKQKILLLGGQTTLRDHIFRQSVKTDNIHLVAECIVSYLTYRKFQGSNFCHGMFKLNSEICKFMDEQCDPKLINNLYDDLKRWENDVNIRPRIWPDRGHLNAQGTFELIDLILSYIEKLEEEK